MTAGGLIRVQHLQVVADHDARAAQLAEHIGHHLVVARKLFMQPDIAECQADLFEQMENQFQLGVDEQFTSDTSVKYSQTHDPVTIGNRHGHLRAK